MTAIKIKFEAIASPKKADEAILKTNKGLPDVFRLF